MARGGYARVSSVGQHLDVQLSKLQHCDKVFQEKHSGHSDERPQLKACLEYVREGDVLIVTRLDRLARSTLHLCQIAEELKRQSVHLQVLDQNIDTGNAKGRLLFNMLGAIGQSQPARVAAAHTPWNAPHPLRHTGEPRGSVRSPLSTRYGSSQADPRLFFQPV